jgi:hypothetical protein
MMGFLIQLQKNISWEYTHPIQDVWIHSHQPINVFSFENDDFFIFSNSPQLLELNDIINHQDGSYVCIHHNKHNQDIIVFNDPLGRMPLIVFQNDNMWSISDDLQSLFKGQNELKKLNVKAVRNYILIKDLYPPLNNEVSFFQHVKMFPMGSKHVIKDSTLTSLPYQFESVNQKLTFKEKTDKVKALLTQSILTNYHEHQSHISASCGLDSLAVLSTLDELNLKIHAHVSAPSVSKPHGTYVMYDESICLKDYLKVTQHTLTIHNQHTQNSYELIDEMLDLHHQPYKLFETSNQSIDIFKSIPKQHFLWTAVMGNLTLSLGHPFTVWTTLLLRLRWVKLVRFIQRHSMITQNRRSELIFHWIKSWNLSANSNIPFVKVHPTDKKLFSQIFRFTTLKKEINSFISRDALALNQYFYYMASKKYNIHIHDITYTPELVKEALSYDVDHVSYHGVNRSLVRIGFDHIPHNYRMNMKFGFQASDTMNQLKRSWKDMKEDFMTALQHPLIQHYCNIEICTQLIDEYEMSDEIMQPLVSFVMKIIILHRFLQREGFYA